MTDSFAGARNAASHFVLLFSAALLLSSQAFAQGTPLKPPVALQPPSSPLAKPAPATSTTPQTASTVKAAPASLARFQTIKADGKVIDLRALPDSAVLKGKSGKTISVARIKQLQARIDNASTTPLVLAKQGQTLKSLATAPAGTRIALPGGKVARAQDLAKVQTIYAKLSTRRVIKAAPVSQPNASAKAAVGQNGLTMSDALKLPAGEVVQVGSHKYTAEQLRVIDTQLKSSKREPRGLTDRIKVKAPAQINVKGAQPQPGLPDTTGAASPATPRDTKAKVVK